VGSTRGRRYVSRLRIDTRPGGLPITAERLSRLPIGQLLHVASAQVAPASGHPNEMYYRMLAVPPVRGGAAEHLDRVLAVYQWAVETDRPGGGVAAVAELWGVAKNPTAYRWLSQARRRRDQDGERR